MLKTMSIGIRRALASPTANNASGKIKHVFVVVLENKNYDDTFGTSTQDPYLQKPLVPMGTLLTQYYGTGHVSLDNYISLISGQASTPDTQNDCLPGFTASIGNYNDVKQTGTTADGQVIASGGCVYPASVKTIADQLTAKGLTWKGYLGDMGNDPAREASACGRGESRLCVIRPRIVWTDSNRYAVGPAVVRHVQDADASQRRHASRVLS